MTATPLVGARFDDLVTGRAWVFGPPRRLLIARSPDEVLDVLAAVHDQTAAGAWAYGYLAYEAAGAFDPALVTASPATTGLPLAWFALAGEPSAGPALAPTPAEPGYVSGPWPADWSAGIYARSVEQVRAAIAAGEVYQCNLTTRLRGPVRGSLAGFYRDLARAQGGAGNAFIDIGPQVIASASPELFFEWTDDALITRPMKGTLARGDTTAADEVQRQRLRTSPKERAENLMIVDLLRNDLARVAELGSVRVEQLFRTERYETLWQLTSTVAARPGSAVRLPDVFAALFPCGSVTGAPKAAAMALSAALEPSPRGVYCGTVGMVAPPGAQFRARFHVAIRTAVIERASGIGVYGSGGGITWGSRPAAEYEEMVLKAAVLLAPSPSFELLETMRYEPATGVGHLERHLARLLDSARYFGFPADVERVRAELVARLAEEAVPAGETRRVRLLLSRDGRLRVEVGPMPSPADRPVGLMLDAEAGPVDRWCRHKTTRRTRYESAAARHPGADDVILTAAGQLIETTTANLALRFGEQWYTPPLSSGCLPGVERAASLAAGRLQERTLLAADLRSADELAVLNSLRGWRVAHLSQP